MQSGPHPELIESPLSRHIIQDGVPLTINIVRIATEPGWSLEVINARGTSVVWSDAFASDREADAALRKVLAEEGVQAFLDN
ncbi:hypothetical protein ATE68_23660 [Sphingopyxis sp. H038]|uniref:hypothetical protein n=1 Tax=Sphingopyxis sp. H053 TaxID=1759067 RepID=UPI0007306C87|nr:hypothetical protein [Sphingopyxis sp. H053]KTD99362.1 hypothetical protein ATE78_23625 [Sphingopyxis sp. H012]KTE16113.1 hypothetical protein ATE75_24325 [Sphingopyxis sp. H080]KTE28925.1 hypothetical protein ATE68_23660 [Sphingopyxis sp. H038]KTE31867.1 hypothetical protein ATE73_24505 [Sphingopyxis sp. H077]KTE44851.1 hypothetical protein ATE77_09705 [Sphingopyxis sp. H005]KTE58150.1 hypothetical protein ATE74_24475 [Sphingopyxis sp. H085]